MVRRREWGTRGKEAVETKTKRGISGPHTPEHGSVKAMGERSRCYINYL